ncbi:MAG: M56 family metallopeptidase, partial [Thermoanaerobaculia bacterium]
LREGLGGPDATETAETADAAPGTTDAPGLPWREALAALWLAGVGLGAAGLARELAAARRMRRLSRPATDPDLLATFEALRRRLRVRSGVELRLSDRVPGPLTTGWLRPAVLVSPRTLENLDRGQRAMALGHELLHVRRGDLWAAWVPRLARWLFFFHPLAALAAREHVLAREAACDAAVLRELDAAPRDYGRLLLRWAPRGPAGSAPEGLGYAAGASPSFVHLKRRLEMLDRCDRNPHRLRPALWTLAVVALAALVPIRITAHAPAPPEPPTTPAEAVPPTAPTPPAAPGPVQTAQVPDAPAPPAAPPPGPAPAAAPEPPRPPEPPDEADGHSWFFSDDGDAWALLDEDAHVWIHGASGDAERARALRDRFDSPVLWFARDGQEYVIRDSATIARAREVLEPQRELGRRQGELGRQQGELGRRQKALGRQQGELGQGQGELGSQQGELGHRQGELGAEQAATAAERAALEVERATGERKEELASRSTELEARRRVLERRMRELGSRQRELAQRQRSLAAEQRELARPQRELAERQRALAERQRELARAQVEAAKRARTEMRRLLDRALAGGLAEPL